MYVAAFHRERGGGELKFAAAVAVEGEGEVTTTPVSWDGQHGNGESPRSETRSLENPLAFLFFLDLLLRSPALSPSHLSSATGFVRVTRCAAGAAKHVIK